MGKGRDQGLSCPTLWQADTTPTIVATGVSSISYLNQLFVGIHIHFSWKTGGNSNMLELLITYQGLCHLCLENQLVQ